MATLSFALTGDCDPIPDPAKLIELICTNRKPKFLLCAGYTLLNKRELNRVHKAATRYKCSAIVEVLKPRQESFLVGIKGLRPVGIQSFSNRRNINEDNLAELSQEVDCRTFRWLRGRLGFLLICGEITVVTAPPGGGASWRPDVPDPVKDALGRASLICNPTHTRMGNAGILAAKRRFLSKNKIYVSCSNWQTQLPNGRAQRISRTLQTVYVNKKKLPYSYEVAGTDFLYREWWVER